jgi:hypothetical protein
MGHPREGHMYEAEAANYPYPMDAKAMKESGLMAAIADGEHVAEKLQAMVDTFVQRLDSVLRPANPTPEKSVLAEAMHDPSPAVARLRETERCIKRTQATLAEVLERLDA